MTRLPASASRVTVTCNAHQEPRRFLWGRSLFIVEQITDVWQVETDWWTTQLPIARRYYCVTTTAGALFVLYVDLGDGGWYLEQVFD